MPQVRFSLVYFLLHLLTRRSQSKIGGWHVWIERNFECTDKNLLKPALFALTTADTNPKNPLHICDCPTVPDDSFPDEVDDDLFKFREWCGKKAWGCLLNIHLVLLWLIFKRKLVACPSELRPFFPDAPLYSPTCFSLLSLDNSDFLKHFCYIYALYIGYPNESSACPSVRHLLSFCAQVRLLTCFPSFDSSVFLREPPSFCSLVAPILSPPNWLELNQPTPTHPPLDVSF
jgi:hypothetical protein